MAKKHQLGDGPIDPSQYANMNNVARFLDDVFNGLGERRVGFVLLVFPYGAGDGRCNYISNGADRRDIIVMMKEQIARFEGQAEAHGRA